MFSACRWGLDMIPLSMHFLHDVNYGVSSLPWSRGFLGQILGRTYSLGKLTVCYGKSPFLMGKSTINGPCSIAMLVHQRVVTLWFTASGLQMNHESCAAMQDRHSDSGFVSELFKARCTSTKRHFNVILFQTQISSQVILSKWLDGKFVFGRKYFTGVQLKRP